MIYRTFASVHANAWTIWVKGSLAYADAMPVVLAEQVLSRVELLSQVLEHARAILAESKQTLQFDEFWFKLQVLSVMVSSRSLLLLNGHAVIPFAQFFCICSHLLDVYTCLSCLTFLFTLLFPFQNASVPPTWTRSRRRFAVTMI